MIVKEKEFVISQSLLQATVDVLAQQPYNTVGHIVPGLMNLSPVENKPESVPEKPKPKKSA